MLLLLLVSIIVIIIIIIGGLLRPTDGDRRLFRFLFIFCSFCCCRLYLYIEKKKEKSQQQQSFISRIALFFVLFVCYRVVLAVAAVDVGVRRIVLRCVEKGKG